MTTRITQGYVKKQIRFLQESFPRLEVHGAYGRIQLCLKSKEGTGWEDTLSGFLTGPEMNLFVDGFRKGAGMGYESGESAARLDIKERAKVGNMTNMPTFDIALVIDNDRELSDLWRLETIRIVEKSTRQTEVPEWSPEQYARFTLADQLKQWYEYNYTGDREDLGETLLQWVFDSVVNWQEIADEMIAEYHLNKEHYPEEAESEI